MNEPQRTCVGCRERQGRSALLRVVAEQVDGQWTVQPDPRADRPGRGAWIHPDESCLGLAERRGAFSRALRLGSGVSAVAVREFVSQR